MTEKQEAKRDGARLQSNSGRGKFDKGDATWYNHVVDYKEYAKSYSVSIENWMKICTDTVKVNVDFQPVIKVILGSKNKKTRLAVVDWDWYAELVEKYYE